MKSEKEIRAYRDDLFRAIKRPCKCAAYGEADVCARRKVMRAITALTLQWVLGEGGSEYDRTIEEIAKMVRE